jgi:hypothetical protein
MLSIALSLPRLCRQARTHTNTRTHTHKHTHKRARTHTHTHLAHVRWNSWDTSASLCHPLALIGASVVRLQAVGIGSGGAGSGLYNLEISGPGNAIDGWTRSNLTVELYRDFVITRVLPSLVCNARPTMLTIVGANFLAGRLWMFQCVEADVDVGGDHTHMYVSPSLTHSLSLSLPLKGWEYRIALIVHKRVSTVYVPLHTRCDPFPRPQDHGASSCRRMYRT